MSVKAEAGTGSKGASLLAIVTGTRIFRWVMLLVVSILLLAQLLSRFEGAYRYPLIQSIYTARYYIMSTVGEGLKQTIPTRIGGRDRTDWLLIVLALAASIMAGRVGDGARRKMFQRQMDAKVASLRADMGLKEGSNLTRELEEKVKALRSRRVTVRDVMAMLGMSRRTVYRLSKA